MTPPAYPNVSVSSYAAEALPSVFSEICNSASASSAPFTAPIISASSRLSCAELISGVSVRKQAITSPCTAVSGLACISEAYAAKGTSPNKVKVTGNKAAVSETFIIFSFFLGLCVCFFIKKDLFVIINIFYHTKVFFYIKNISVSDGDSPRLTHLQSIHQPAFQPPSTTSTSIFPKASIHLSIIPSFTSFDEMSPG